MWKVGILTASDKGSMGLREDISGALIAEMLPKDKYIVEKYIVVADDFDTIKTELTSMCDVLNLDFILTTGGTGFSVRDITPEATLAVIERNAFGISEAIRANSLKITSRAMLSRGVAGIRGKTLIVNLPGSPKAVRECLEYILVPLEHGIEILLGSASECGK